MPRLPDIDPALLDPEQRRVHDEILSGPRGIVEGPLRVWVNNPGLADKAQALGAYCRYGTSLPQRLSELAIVTTGAYWRAGFEWAVHGPIALKPGLDPDAVEAIRIGATPRFAKADEAAVHEPPATGASMRFVSPSFVVTRSMGRPSTSAAICVRIV